MEQIKQLLDQYPYLTLLTYGGNEYVGIIQNCDEQITTIYDFASLKTPEQKLLFLQLGDTWWWESNRLVPINLFLKEEWIMFKPYLRTFNNKSLTVVHGPICSILELAKRKSKRKSIEYKVESQF